MHATDEADHELERAARLVRDESDARELRSHLYEVAARGAARRGAERIEAQDIAEALEEAGGEETLARLFARRSPASLGQRALAYALDLVLVYGLAMLVWGAVWLALVFVGAALGRDLGLPRPDPFQLVDLDDIPGPADLQAGVPLDSVAAGAIVGLFVIGLPFVYFLRADARSGQTVGKRLLRLRLVGARGRPSGGAAVLRAASKASPLFAPLLLLDALFGRGGRWSDGALGVVVRQEPGDEPSPRLHDPA